MIESQLNLDPASYFDHSLQIATNVRRVWLVADFEALTYQGTMNFNKG